MSMAASIPEKAAELFLEGYNCAQSVYSAFAPLMGITEKQAAKMASALGGGLCRMRETCGAVSGAMMVLGALKGYDIPDDQAKKILYARGQRIMKQFKESFGTLNCLELLQLPKDSVLSPVPTPRTQEFYQKRPCARFIFEMARLLEEELEKQDPAL